VSVGVLLRVADEDARADRLDPERCVAVGKLRVGERARGRNVVPRAVEDIDACVVEVGRVEPRIAGC
jgi:hypothetical protein